MKLNAQRRGTFAIVGAATDTGTGTARRTVSGTRLVLVETLKSTRGTLVLRVEQLCAKTTGGWRVLAGTAAYAGTTGSGTTTVRSPCLAGPLRIAHTGRLKIPPPPTPPPAVPAKVLYGGWTGQDEDVALEVAGDGRTITLIHIGRVSAPCAPNASPFSTAEIRITGPVPVADDGTFTAVQAPVTVTGRLVQGRIEGTLALQTSYPSYQPGQTITCSASGITWNATSSPPPPRVALPGTYCGFSNQGKGICIDVAPDGLTVTSVRDGIRVSCGVECELRPRQHGQQLALAAPEPQLRPHQHGYDRRRRRRAALLLRLLRHDRHGQGLDPLRGHHRHPGRHDLYLRRRNLHVRGEAAALNGDPFDPSFPVGRPVRERTVARRCPRSA